MRPNGPACEVNTGSVIITMEAVRIRKVECPMKVTAASPGSTWRGAAAWVSMATRLGHAVRWRVRIHVMTSFSGRADRCGLKNLRPSQWSLTGYVGNTLR